MIFGEASHDPLTCGCLVQLQRQISLHGYVIEGTKSVTLQGFTKKHSSFDKMALILLPSTSLACMLSVLCRNLVFPRLGFKILL